jgi:GGDEF domain-containing protein
LSAPRPCRPVGGAAAGTAFWAYETGPGVYWQLSELRGADGKPLLSEEEARNYALGASVPLGAMMSVGLEGAGLSFTKWASSKPIAEKVLSALAQQSVEKVLARKGMAAALGRAALNYGTHSVQGGLVMASQSALTQATLELAAGQHGVDAPGTITDAFADGFSTGIRDFAIIAAWGPARRMLAEHGQIRASQESAQVLRDIAENTRESKLAQRDPEQFGKLIDRFGPDKKVYVTREAFDEFAQEKKVSPRELAAGIIGDKGEAYDAGVTTGSIAIPMGKWAEKVVLAGHDKKLGEDARTSLDELTPRMTKDAIKAIAKSLQERADARGPSFESEVRDLRKTLFGVAKEAKYSRDQADAWADQISRYAATMSLRMDVPLRDAMVRTGLPQLRLEGREVLTGKLVEALKVTPEEARAVSLPQAEESFAGLPDSALADVSAVRAAAKTPEQKAAAERLARAAYTDALIPELGNAKAHTEFMSSEQAKGGVHVITDMPGLKARNDKYGQLEGDRALQKYGGAFSAESRAQKGKAHRMSTGDEFYAWFPDQAKADEFVRGLKARLAGPEGLLRDGDSLSTYAGVGPSKDAAAAELVKAKATAKAKYGDSRNGGKVGHGESFVSVAEEAARANGGVLPQDEHVKLKMPKGSDAQDKRGTIRFSVDKAGRAYDFDIRALHGDASTLAHESGHWLSWSLHDIAMRADAPESVKADYASILKLGGWGSPEERVSDNAERSRLAALKKPDEAQKLRLLELTAKEERLSHAWEMYLGEGKAPEPGLRRTFARFRRWMGETYGSLGGIAAQYRKTYGEDLWLSDEVRGVFNRLLAVDNEVERMKQDDARLDAGGVLNLTPEEQKRLAELRQRKYEDARGGLDRAVANYNGEAAKGFLRAERERLRAEVTDEIGATSPYAAWTFLRDRAVPRPGERQRVRGGAAPGGPEGRSRAPPAPLVRPGPEGGRRRAREDSAEARPRDREEGRRERRRTCPALRLQGRAGASCLALGRAGTSGRHRGPGGAPVRGGLRAEARAAGRRPERGR